MLHPDIRKEDVADMHASGFFSALVPVNHIDDTIEYNKYFFTFVGVPFVRLIGPVQTSGNAIHIGNRQRIPGGRADEIARANKSQRESPPGLSIGYSENVGHFGDKGLRHQHGN
jgi:hypothetical protein